MTYYIGHVAAITPWHYVIVKLIYLLFLQVQYTRHSYNDFYPIHGYILITE